MTMKPVTHHIKPFTVDRVQAIRISREITLADGRQQAVGKGHAKKRSKSGSSTKPRKPKVVLDTRAQKQLEGLDPATRAFLEKAMK
jgi:hypothetical protein